MKALLIVNLGTPDTATTPDVKKYLKQFLMDEEVIDIPFLLRYPLVNWIIAPTRSPKSAHAYQSIFTERGSPLRFNTEDFTAKLKVELKGGYADVRHAMRYGAPSIASVFADLKSAGVTELDVVAMYPQFAKSSTRTVLRELPTDATLRPRTLIDFYDESEFIAAFRHQIQVAAASFQPDHLLLSYHGLPESHVKEFGPGHCLKSSACCDRISEKNRYCYRAQCMASSREILKGVPASLQQSYTIGFQSRLGRQEWIKPYTDREIMEIARSGKKRVLVACPAFVSDCLETLEEIGIRLKADFLAAGGEDLMLVPSLNATDVWVRGFAEMLTRRENDFISVPEALIKLKNQ